VKEPAWIEARELLVLHGRVLALHGGPSGVRDLGLLESAIARPREIFLRAAKPDMFQMAAAYTSGIVRNHPFVDGNKRVGFIAGILFLELNGYKFAASEEEAARAVIDLASRALDEPGYARFLRANTRRQKSARR
jgi:death on curing protein